MSRGLDQKTEGVTPYNNGSLSQDRLIDRIRLVAAEYKVSERTARRYLKRGELPRKDPYRWIGSDGQPVVIYARCIGRDGKTYPREIRRSPGRPRTPLKRDLALAYQAIMRVGRKSDVDGFYPEDLEDLRLICHEANAMLTSFEDGIKEEEK